MAVVDNDLANVAELACGCFGEEFVIAGVPGGFVVDQHLDFLLPRDVADGERVFERGGERLFDHGADVVAGCGLNHFAMIGDGGVDQDGVGMLLDEHLFEVGVEKLGVEMEFSGVVFGEQVLGLDDGDERGAVVFGKAAEEAFGVAVDETDESDTDGFFGFIGGSRQGIDRHEESAESRK